MTMKPFNWRWFRNAALVVLVLSVPLIYLWFSPLNQELYSPLLFTPVKKTDGPWTVREVTGHTYEDVFFQSKGGKKLHGWYFDVPNAKRTILFLHGKGGNLSERTLDLELLLTTNSNVFIFDYQGYGLSEGAPSLTNICDDAKVAFDYLVNEKHAEPKRIILFGESLGSCFAGELSTKVSVGGVILQSPLASLRRKGGELIAVVTKNAVRLDFIYPPQMWPYSGFDNVKIFQKPHAPLLLVSGTKDSQIPTAHADDIFKQASESKFYARIVGAEHTGDPNLSKAPEYKAALKNFLVIVDTAQNTQ